MKKFGLIGYPLSHSFSKQFFSEKFSRENINDCSYELYPITKIQELTGVLEKEKGRLKGLNVTIPYKIEVISYLDQISEEAQKIGAVNCVKIDTKNLLSGYNTDVYGFRESLRPLLKSHHQKALVLGNGGAAKAVIFALKQLNIEYKLVSRTKQDYCITYNDIDTEMMESHHLMINTTPLGMSPDLHSAPDIPYAMITSKHLAFDLVYNPEKTLFLSKCEAQGSTIKNGLEMLHLQALKAWEIWNQ